MRGDLAYGFTLVELLLVVMLLGLLSSVAVPRLNRSVRSRALSMAARDLSAMVDAGRVEAVRRGLKVRLSLDPRKGEYWLSLQVQEHSNREEYGAFEDGLLDTRWTLPQGVTVEGFKRDGAGNRLVFEPSGLGEEVQLRVADASGSRITIGIKEWYEQPSAEEGPP